MIRLLPPTSKKYVVGPGQSIEIIDVLEEMTDPLSGDAVWQRLRTRKLTFVGISDSDEQAIRAALALKDVRGASAIVERLTNEAKR